MKYEVGNRVIIRDDLIPEKQYNNCRFDPYMTRFCGREAEVLKIVESRYGTRYKIDIDRQYFSWSDGMILGLVEPQKPSEFYSEFVPTEV